MTIRCYGSWQMRLQLQVLLDGYPFGPAPGEPLSPTEHAAIAFVIRVADAARGDA